MRSNDLLRRLRYALDLPDHVLLDLIREGGWEVEPEFITDCFRDDADPDQASFPRVLLGALLEGLIRRCRGPVPEGKAAPGDQAGKGRGGPVSAGPSGQLDNNGILKSLRVALRLREEDLLAVMAAGGQASSPNELRALFRQEGSSNYRSCGDQFMRAFLAGLALRRPALPWTPAVRQTVRQVPRQAIQ